jgi:hypothetical protein
MEGHEINPFVEIRPDDRPTFCRDCGSPVISACPECGGRIQGWRRGATMWDYTPPIHCDLCGKPLPWTVSRLDAARTVASMLSELKPAERQALSASFDDLVHDTTRTQAAVLRVKLLLGKLSVEGGRALRDVLMTVATESVKKQLGM